LILGYVADAINAGKSSIPRKQEEAAKSEEFKAVPSIR
jgi:ABC-type amino acid transport system permease subunit